MKSVFLDTNCIIALFSAKDALHARAIERWEELSAKGFRFVTMLSNLTEFLAYASDGGENVRRKATEFVDRIRSSPDIEVIDGDRQLFDEGLQLYRNRLDKTYSHVDCMAMVICQRMKISEVLTGDRDFQREGLTILL